jgi:uncharacterized Ntn-hydrolase superfamily protein
MINATSEAGMTFSILARDPGTGEIGGAAATGSLCVGGWVLRADPAAGASASQGAAPSTFWGQETLARMAQGEAAEVAVAAVTGADGGRAHRQLAALDVAGGTGAFTGASNTDVKGARRGAGWVASGNLLAGEAVLDALVAGFAGGYGALADRLLAGLRQAEAAGGDSRGLQSAALLVVSPVAPPLTLRVDWSADPVSDLAALLARTREPAYADWLRTVPVADDPERTP